VLTESLNLSRVLKGPHPISSQSSQCWVYFIAEKDEFRLVSEQETITYVILNLLVRNSYIVSLLREQNGVNRPWSLCRYVCSLV